MLLFIAHGLLGFCLDALAFKKVPAVRIVQSTLMLWLSKVYGIPAGMYASQVWGTVYLSSGRFELSVRVADGWAHQQMRFAVYSSAAA